MAKEIKLNLPPADDLFSTQEERDDLKREKVLDIHLSEIDGFPEHPFQVKADESNAGNSREHKNFWYPNSSHC